MPSEVHNIDMEHIETPTPRLQEQYAELAEQLYAPWLSEERKTAIRRRLGYISFELDSREHETSPITPGDRAAR